ncbi:putative gamma-glutamylcyclotransferase CG2811 isoform X2 [Bradysia coprophila]|uniref:putative gamma-glutamylcyclotransferase CG2811 isoform X2 n=1 Tax=Bradysia coprophila TaxID=38358 RepID=UPI00187DD143|nr:putative gamma-glutamylcyclotransferase CG2811 isoform X2 [Bradysia coprophila]
MVKSTYISEMSNSLLKVFVYGTLKNGQPNHHWLTNTSNGLAKFLAQGKTKDLFPLVIATPYNVPFLLNNPGIGLNIKGEIYDIDERMLGQLDILEDYPRLYDRQIQDIVTCDGIIQCWMYLLKSFPNQLLDKPHMDEYKNSIEMPYIESYITNCTPDDLIGDSANL